MRFTEEVVLFDFAGIPMVGCLGTGYAIGLTEQGAAVCARMLEEDVPEDDVTAVDPALLEHLARGGFFQRVVAEPRVLSAYLHVTQRCNLACAGCYSLDEHRNRLADAPLADMKRAVEGLAAAGLSQLIISGGEPFLREDLPDIVEHAKRVCGIASVTVLSNGTRMTEEALERLAPNVDCVSVSFDGCSAAAPAYIRGEQRFDELVEAVRMVQRAGIPAHIIPTVHAKNVDDLASYVQLSRDLGASLNFSLLTCEPDDEVLGGLLPGADELRMLGRALLTLDNGKPLPAMDAPVGVNLTVKRNCGAGCKSRSVAAA
ncbi:radical SAM protein, partial [Bifidobacterium longum]